MTEGIRVVRGPDWNCGEQDGGEGHVGTVINDNGDKTVSVLWDMGELSTCRAGKDGMFDLRVFDSAPAGIKHNGVTCDECQKNGFMGVRWKCATCADYDLCSVCYRRDAHNAQHPFIRITTPGDKGSNMPKRMVSVRLRALGMFPTAIVQRGKNWEYGIQDGGPGSRGEIDGVKNYSSTGGERNAVRVRWDNGEVNVYRVGFRGKVDLKCVEEAAGSDYYRDHLQVLDSSSAAATQPIKPPVAPRPKTAPAPSRPQPQPRTSQSLYSDPSALRVGDRACVELPEVALKEAQRGHGGWSMRMSQCIGQAGTVKSFEDNGDINLEIGGNTWRFFKGAVRKVFNLNVGDIVMVLDHRDKVQAMQTRHGGWQSDMLAVLGKTGKVVKIDSDGDVAVAFGQRAWVFNPGCLIPAPGTTPTIFKDDEDAASTTEEFERPGTSASEQDPGQADTDAIARMIANLLARGSLDATTADPQHLVSAAAQGDTRTVERVIKQSPQIIDSPFQGLAALIIASHEGNLEVVKILVQAGANMEVKEEKGNTPLLAALMGKKESVAPYLIQNGANMHAANHHQRNALHAAATNGANNILKYLMEKGLDINKQDSFGDTPLHDTINNQNSTGTSLILRHPNVNLYITNKKGQNPLHLAVSKDDNESANMLISKMPGIVNVPKENGYTPLHIAAVNNLTSVAKELLKGKPLVDAVSNKDRSTPLHLAAHQAYPEMTKLLLESGADNKSVDNEGLTPLHYAMLGKRKKQDPNILRRLMVDPSITIERELQDRATVACLLVKSGANPNARDRRNRTPFDMCENDRLRNTVRNFIEENSPQPQRQVRIDPLAALLLGGLPDLCMVCRDEAAEVRFLPCRHKVTCERCCFRRRECPSCGRYIQERVDSNGRILLMEPPCKVQ